MSAVEFVTVTKERNIRKEVLLDLGPLKDSKPDTSY